MGNPASRLSRVDAPAEGDRLGHALELLVRGLPLIDDERERAPIEDAIGRCRRSIAGATEQQSRARAVADLFDAAEGLARSLAAQEAAYRIELRRAIVLVREAMGTLLKDGTDLAARANDAGTRFTALLQISDLPQLKRQLESEVQSFGRLALERQRQWTESRELFESRIERLELQILRAEEETTRDALTGLANRRLFDRSLRAALGVPHPQLTIAALDLDNFKAVNDIGGHAAGDQFLKRVADLLRERVRSKDLVARTGGDEFTLLCVGLPLRDAEARMRTLVSGLGSIPTGIVPPVGVSASCGLTEYYPGDTAETLLTRADQALYDAKREGKARVAMRTLTSD